MTRARGQDERAVTVDANLKTIKMVVFHDK